MPFINLRPADTAAQCIVEDHRISHPPSPAVAHISNLVPRTPLCNATRPSSYSRRAAISPATPIASHPFASHPLVALDQLLLWRLTCVAHAFSRHRTAPPPDPQVHNNIIVFSAGINLLVLTRSSGFPRNRLQLVYYALFSFGMRQSSNE